MCSFANFQLFPIWTSTIIDVSFQEGKAYRLLANALDKLNTPTEVRGSELGKGRYPNHSVQPGKKMKCHWFSLR